MNIRPITDGYAVTPQIEPKDMAALAEAGFATVICNRPDGENPPHLQAAAMQQAAEEAGLAFVYNPVTPGQFTEDRVEEQAEAMAGSDGPVLAYCASGTRSTITWALGQAGEMSSDEILKKAAAAGYDLSQMRPMLDAAAARNGG